MSTETLSLVLQIIAALGVAVTALGTSIVMVMGKINALKIEQMTVTSASNKRDTDRRMDDAIDKSNARAERVEATLEVAAQKQQDIYHQGNSAAGAQLKISAMALRRVAELTKEPHDLAIADEAQRLYDVHMAKDWTIAVNKTARDAQNG